MTLVASLSLVLHPSLTARVELAINIVRHITRHYEPHTLHSVLLQSDGSAMYHLTIKHIMLGFTLFTGHEGP
jgi:hypothetical protein